MIGSDERECKEKIGNELEHIRHYVESFRICSARDGQALADILMKLADLNAAIAKIEESHRRRIELMNELSKALTEMENETGKFEEKYGKAAQ